MTITRTRDTISLEIDATGNSPAIYLPAGLWALSIAFSSTGSATLQASGSTAGVWRDVLDELGEVITVTAGSFWVVEGGLQYRLNVASLSGTITLTAERMNAGSM